MCRYFRPLSVAVALLVAAVGLTACSDHDRAPSPDASNATATAQPVTITWSFWGDDWELAVNQRMARAFEEEHPGIHVEIVHRPWSQYFTWLREEWRDGRSPDVMFLNYIPSYVAMGELEPLDRYVKNEATLMADFYPALLAGFRANNQIYGIPRDNDTKVIYYNRSLFQEAGMPLPRPDWTWEDLRRTAVGLTDQGAAPPRYGFGFEPDFWWLVWLWQNGGEIVDDPMQPTKVLLDSPENADALQFLQNLIHSDRVTPPVDQLNTEDMAKLFRDGRLAMLFGNHALVPWFTNTAELSWDVVPLPRGRTRANVAGGAGYTISRRSEHKDAAWQLVRFLSGQKAQAILTESGLITPARRSVREDNIFIRQQPYEAAVFLGETEHGRPVPNFPGVTEMERVIDEGLLPVWRGERPAADVLTELIPKVERVIGLDGS
jgi:ABC-type glycerol-3-phosphate transport system substrate-binding protein